MQGNPLPFCHRKAMFFYCRGGLSILYRKGNEPLSNFPQRKTEEIVTPASQAHEDKIKKEEIATLASLAITDYGTGSSRRLRLRLSLTRKGVHDNGAVEDSHVVLTHRLPNA